MKTISSEKGHFLMMNELDKLKIESIISAKDISYSPLESELAEKFDLSAEQFRTCLLESDNLEEFLSKLNMMTEVEENDKSN
jgi:hypothetical protein